MIRAAEPHERIRASILDHFGKPMARQAAPKRDLSETQPKKRRGSVEARYDAAQDTDWNQAHWANADTYDADSANSKAVRGKLVPRSRYEVGNNGYAAGMLHTHANYLIGEGPKLRMQTGNKPFNEAIEAIWKQWTAAIQFRRKLWCMAHAKSQDGEAFAIVATNPRLRTRIKLDLRLIETEQVQSPLLPVGEPNYIDGIKFDDFGNPEYYEVLRNHPGSTLTFNNPLEAEQVSADWMLHWFTMKRPGQHRGIPELASTLNIGAGSRRHREATLVAAESAANIAVLLSTDMAPDDAELVTPFSSVQTQKGQMVALPYGYSSNQMKAEHPNATYDTFHRKQISELGRPISMPHNLGAADSSDHNFASGKLDFQPYALHIDLDRADCDLVVLDKLFGLFFAECVDEYQFNSPPDSIPAHTWDWPQNMPADSRAQAIADNLGLRNGSQTLSQLYSDRGYNAEEQAAKEAEFFGIPVEQYKARIFGVLMPQPTASQQAAPGIDPQLVQDLQDATDSGDPQAIQDATQAIQDATDSAANSSPQGAGA